tara:strand:- start:1874 stop:2170 length:297 start_codon:yes stop_codon:yes gene_type:complete
MSETIEGANGVNVNADFMDTSDPSYYEADSEPDQLYLESVLPQAYDPTLEPFNTTGLRPKEYPEQNEYGFHPIQQSPYQNDFNNSDKYFTPENLGQGL